MSSLSFSVRGLRFVGSSDPAAGKGGEEKEGLRRRFAYGKTLEVPTRGLRPRRPCQLSTGYYLYVRQGAGVQVVLFGTKSVGPSGYCQDFSSPVWGGT